MGRGRDRGADRRRGGQPLGRQGRPAAARARGPHARHRQDRHRPPRRARRARRRRRRVCSSARDLGRIAERAVHGIDGAFLVDGPSTGSALDTRRAAAQFAELGCGCVVALGGDGTCRDVAMGWPDVTLVAISTGTNNVFPVFVDGSSAGTAAGPRGVRPHPGRRGRCTRRSACSSTIEQADGTAHRDIALVDVAADRRARHRRAGRGARRSHPQRRGGDRLAREHRAVEHRRTHAIRSGATSPAPSWCTSAGRPTAASRRVRVPIVPGSFSELDVALIERLADGEGVGFAGPLRARLRRRA